MTGCAQAAPQGDALYEEASEQYFPMAEDMHGVIMAIHEGEWTVDQGGYGAQGTSCQRGADEFGYMFNYVRVVTLEDLDAEALSAAAASAFDELGLTPAVTVRGEGEGEEHVVVAEGERIGRAVVTIRPAHDQVRVTARTECAPGSAHDVSALVFGEERLPAGVSRRLPAFEGPDSVPQFYFPADGPVYYNEDGTPVVPQPVVTEYPKAPYGA
ncbi:hypothetical protein GCM10027416_32490 [Okibacterium endophyticum]